MTRTSSLIHFRHSLRLHLAFWCAFSHIVFFKYVQLILNQSRCVPNKEINNIKAFEVLLSPFSFVENIFWAIKLSRVRSCIGPISMIVFKTKSTARHIQKCFWHKTNGEKKMNGLRKLSNVHFPSISNLIEELQSNWEETPCNSKFICTMYMPKT